VRYIDLAERLWPEQSRLIGREREYVVMKSVPVGRMADRDEDNLSPYAYFPVN
jgi:hypothetical protein